MSDATSGPTRPTDEELLRSAPTGSGGKEAQVGVFVLVGLIAFLVVLFWMTDPATLRGRYMLVTEVSHAGGVRKGDPIQMQGINIGRVNKFEMLGDERDVVRVDAEAGPGMHGADERDRAEDDEGRT